MPTPSLWINPNDPELKQRIDSLQPTPGYCIFMDIVGSTAMKQQGMRHWIALLHNCFANARVFLYPYAPLKAIGDSLMYYIELSDLTLSGYTPLQIFDGLWQIATEGDSRFPVVRIGAARCEQAYALTFLRGGQDYYGIDIDMTARLQEIAKQREVAIEERFYEDITADYRRFENREQFVSYRSLRGPESLPLKGVSNFTKFFRTFAST